MTVESSVMTWNLRGANPNQDGINAWVNREDLVRGTIHDHRPELLGTQETQYKNLHTFQYDSYIHENYDWYEGESIDRGNFNPIFWDKTKYTLELLQQRGCFYLHPNYEPAVANEWGAASIRAATWVILRHIQSGKDIWVCCSHWDYLDERARIGAAQMILREWHRIPKERGAFVADANEGIYVPPNVTPSYTGEGLLLLQKAGFIDLFGTIHKDSLYTNTFTNFEQDDYDPNNSHGLHRCDVIYGIGLTPIDAEILRVREGKISGSDHDPVTIIFEM